MAFEVKVYIVQQANSDGHLHGEVIACKLSFNEAQRIAYLHAPAKVTTLIADKTAVPNGPGQIGHQQPVHLIAQSDPHDTGADPSS